MVFELIFGGLVSQAIESQSFSCGGNLSWGWGLGCRILGDFALYASFAMDLQLSPRSLSRLLFLLKKSMSDGATDSFGRLAINWKRPIGSMIENEIWVLNVRSH